VSSRAYTKRGKKITGIEMMPDGKHVRKMIFYDDIDDIL
jgi:hypothetical protein